MISTGSSSTEEARARASAGRRRPRRVRLAVAVLAGLTAISAPSLALATDTWSDPFPGVRRLHRQTSNRNINALVVDLCAPGVSVRATASEERHRTTSSFGTLVGAQAAINGDLFSYETYATRGLSMHAGVPWPDTSDWGGAGPIAFGPRRVELYHHDPVTPVESWMQEIVSGYPTVVWDGAAVPLDIGSHCTTQHPRTIIGLSADRHTLYLVVVDGRASSRVGMTCPEMSQLMLELGAYYATSMDGGGSSTMWLQGQGVVNVPSDGSQRSVANHLGVYASGSGPAPYCHCVPVAETCNGADDDCDGAVDEELVQPCGSDVGACQAGTQVCSSGAWGECTGLIGPTAEVCNGVDDDCDGPVDEELTRPCGSDVGVCRPGIETCSAGAWVDCTGVGPTPEVCDDEDDDCDGPVDEHDVCPIEELTLAPVGAEEGSTDVDGDGRADVCGLTPDGVRCARGARTFLDRLFVGPALPPAVTADPAWIATLRSGDIDGDGRADLCVREPTGVACFRSSGRDLTEPLALLPLATIADPTSSTGIALGARSTFRLADVDGDGRDDVCERSAAGFCCFRAQGHGFAAEPSCLEALGDAAGFGAIPRYGSIRMGDVNGDHRADVCALDGEHLVCWLAAPGADGELAFSARIEGPAWRDADGWADFGSWSTIRLVDLDGDGRADVCGRARDGLWCHLSQGQGFGEPIMGPRLSDEAGWGHRSRFSTVRMGDVDGDGRADVCARGGDGITCWRFTGDGFGRALAGPALGDAAGWNRPDRYRTIRLADVTGDGRADLCARGDDALSCWEAGADGFTRRLRGPAWADAAGWAEPLRYLSIRAAGNSGVAVAGGEVVGSCGCRAAGRSGKLAAGAGAAGLVALALAFLAGRRRRPS